VPNIKVLKEIKFCFVVKSIRVQFLGTWCSMHGTCATCFHHWFRSIPLERRITRRVLSHILKHPNNTFSLTYILIAMHIDRFRRMCNIYIGNMGPGRLQRNNLKPWGFISRLAICRTAHWIWKVLQLAVLI